MITLTREEAQQVLDALEDAADHIGCPDDDDAIGVARRTLRARLAQPEPSVEPVVKMKELLEVQGRDGNWNLDPYMQGMYNGMELMVALAEGRDPVFRKAPEKWLSASPQRVYCSCGDGIVPDDGALCGTCVSLKDAVKQEPVAWHEPGSYSNVTVYKKWAEENKWLPLYSKGV
jgi:hypothetical protein